MPAEDITLADILVVVLLRYWLNPITERSSGKSSGKNRMEILVKDECLSERNAARRIKKRNSP